MGDNVIDLIWWMELQAPSALEAAHRRINAVTVGIAHASSGVDIDVNVAAILDDVVVLVLRCRY